MKSPKVNILVYDIETCLHLGHYFSLGKQVLRHNQLLKGYFFRPHVMCITYKWLHEKKTHILTWGSSEKDEQHMLSEFDKLIKTADVVIGKNSNRFDNKHINTQRLLSNVPGMPEWIKHTDDLESQMRRYFYLPSYSLDYFSELLGFGGKDKMQFGDWQDMANYRMWQLTKQSASLLTMLTGSDVEEIKKKGIKATDKMFKYGKKDTKDTSDLIKYCATHFEWKYNAAAKHGDRRCKNPICGSTRIKKNGTRVAGLTRYQHFACSACGSYAGKATIRKDGRLGKMS